MVCSLVHSKVCFDMPLKMARSPQQPLLDNERRDTRELSGNLTLGEEWGQSSLSLVGK